MRNNLYFQLAHNTSQNHQPYIQGIQAVVASFHLLYHECVGSQQRQFDQCIADVEIF